MMPDDPALADHGQDLAERRPGRNGIFAGLQAPRGSGDLGGRQEDFPRPNHALVFQVGCDLRQARAMAQEHRGGGSLAGLGAIAVVGP